MAEQDKAVKFISKLVQLTQDKEIKWDSTSAPRNSEVAFETKIEGRHLKIYRYSERIPNPDYAVYTDPYRSIVGSTLSSLTFSSSRNLPPPETIIRSGVVLEIFDENGRAVYKFDNRTGLSDLYESASYSAAKVDELMDSVLGKD